MLRGTDISAYQSSIPAGDFCIMKATEGITYNDGPFASRWKTLGQRGTLRGAYHFSHPKNDPVAEADHFLRVVLAAGLKPGDLLVLDHEVSDGTSASHCAAWAKTWCSRVHAKTGVTPVVYTFLSFAQEGRCAGLGGYPLWMADPSRPAGNPRVPAPWTKWALHQFGSPGGVDQNVFNGDRAAWLALGGSHNPTPTPTPVEDDMLHGNLDNGTNATTPISFPRGAAKAIGFFADTGKAGPGKDGKPQVVHLRVAVEHATGAYDVKEVTVDSSKGKTVVPFAIPKFASCVSVTRIGGNASDDIPVAWDAS